MKLKYNTADTQFSRVLTKRVNNYFIRNNISKKSDFQMRFKAILFFMLFLFFYTISFLFKISIYNYLMLQILTGFFIILTSLNVGHDAMHGAFSSKSNVNYLLGLVFNLSGSNSYVWKMMHNIHHRYPNLHGFDNDISHQNLIRMSPYEKHFWFHKYQHRYVFILALFTTLDYLFYKDFHNFFSKKIGNISMPKHSKKEILILFLSKFLHIFLFLVLPSMFFEFSIFYILFGFLIMHFTSGFILYFIFTPAHLNLKVSFEKPDMNTSNFIDSTWAKHQLFTTSNYGNDFFSDICFGGLNNQIEHHLFPGICHTHYKSISHIIKKTTYEFNLPYFEYHSFKETITANLNFLYKLGNDPMFIK